MLERLKNVLLTIFESDRISIQIIKQNIGEDAAENYPVPPENIEELSNRILKDDNAEIIDAYTCEEDEVYARKTIEKGSNVLFFRFKDIKIRRRKIYRFGDYYIKLFHSGLNKWDFLVLTKSRIMLAGEFADMFYPAQHPHIQDGRPCLSSFETPIRASITNYNITGFMWNFKLYLDKWNYRSPYHTPERFEFNSYLEWDEPHLLNSLSLGMITNTFDYKESCLIYRTNESGNDFVTNKRKAFPSARCKAYDTEPLSRIMFESTQWRDIEGNRHFPNSSSNYRNNMLSYNIESYLRNNFTFEHNHDSIVLLRELHQLLYHIGIERQEQNNPTFSDDDKNLLSEMMSFKDSLKFYQHKTFKYEKHPDIIGADYYLYYLHDDISLEDDIMTKTTFLDNLTKELVSIRDKCDYENSGIIRFEDMQKLWFELLKPEHSEPISINDLLVKAANLPTDNNKECNKKTRIKEIELEYRNLIPILNKVLKDKKIEHYKEELRRLTENENTTKIDTLNL